MVFIIGTLVFVVALLCDAEISTALAFGCLAGIIVYVVRANRQSTQEIAERQARQAAGKQPPADEAQLQTILRRLGDLENEVARLRAQLSGEPFAPTVREPDPEPVAVKPTPADHQPAIIPSSVEPPTVTPATVPPTAVTRAAAVDTPTSSIDFSTPATPPAPQSAKEPKKQLGTPLLDMAKAWLFGGNTLVRVGVLVLFVGVSLLAKFAADYGMFPVELRLTGVAIGAIAMLGVGWRLRSKRTGYALIIQGGGIGILYLNIFAAFRLYHLMPQLMVFGLLVTVCVLAAILAVRQNAPSLAVMGSLGGFLAPVLISTGGGSHVALFSYYALLNAGIFGIAWFRAWRPLNLLGFTATLAIASLWGALSYTPDKLWSTEPFLILFLLFYSGIALCYAIRRQLRLKNYLDSVLVFGTPLAFCALQTGLMHDIRFAMAWSAVGLGAYYLLIAAWLKRYRRETLQMLFESSLGLGILFTTLVIPFATLDERITAAAWALEGAALLWAGLRLQRRLLLYSGLLLQGIAGGVLLLNRLLGGGDPAPFATGYLSALLLAAAGIFSAWQLQRHKAQSEPLGDLAGLSLLTGLWGLFWWLGGNSVQILDHIMLDSVRLTGFVLLALASALIAHLLQTLLRWREAEWVALALSPVLLLLALLTVGLDSPMPINGQWLWLLAFVCAWVLLYRERQLASASILDWCHPLLTLALSAVGFMLIREQFNPFDTHWSRRETWAALCATGIPLTLILCRLPKWPIRAYPRAYLLRAGLPLLALFNLAALSSVLDQTYWLLADGLLWPLAGLLTYGLLYRLDTLLGSKALGLLHAVGGYALGLLGMCWLARLFDWWDLSTTWYWSAWAYLGGLLLVLFSRCPFAWPMQRYLTTYRLWLGGPLALLLGLWSFLMLARDGDPAPLAYLPLLNPLDIAQLLVGYALFDWLRAPPIRAWLEKQPWPAYALGACVFLWLNAVLLRTLHFWGDIAYRPDALFASTTVQMALSLFWAALALTLMLWAVRRGIRLLWLVGAVLLGITVLKLFVVDLASIGSIERIVSFIGVGLLLLLIGYFAPLPPHKKDKP